MHQSIQHTDFDALMEQVHKIGKEVVAVHADDVDKQARFPKESIEAIKALKLMSAYVPANMGGMGLSVGQVAKICETLGHYCGSTAMIYAMHKIQVACLTHHYSDSPYLIDYMSKLVNEQRLIASATTEIGIGGDLRSSICAVEMDGDSFTLTKKAPVISYALDADDILVTARRKPDSAASDQVQVMFHKGQYELEPISGWDTLGFRGTCSSGFVISGKGSAGQIFPENFGEILSESMHPFAHIVWASLWSGIAADAVNKARKFIRNQAKKNINAPPISAIRLGEVDSVLQNMRNNIAVAEQEYSDMLTAGDKNAFSNFGFGIRINNLKTSSAQLIVDIVGKSMLICGIASYRNDSPMSLSRHIRDAYGAALMVNNDRIMLHNSTLLLMHREDH